MEQNHQRQEALLQGLKACEINYKAHTSKHGTTTEQEFNLWLSELQDMSPIKIAQSFKLHLQNSAFFPTIADIRNAISEHRRAKAADEWNTNVKALPAPDKKPMPMKAKLTLLKLMDEAHQMMMERGTTAGPNRMYFETGQGNALSSEAHHGADQVTLEARCYGFARRYQPFLLNTVVGFIGPEYLENGPQITRAALEDHFMGKLLGISMGCDACFTYHADMTQNELECLKVLLGAAGCSYLMSMPVGDDIMLNYQSTSYHDIPSVRGLLGKRPTPEFDAWLHDKGIMDGLKPGPRFGDPEVIR